MPIPFILGAIAIAAGAAGVGSGIHGAVKMKGANDTMHLAKYLHEQNMKKFEEQNKITTAAMDELGTKELEILQSFTAFSDAFEKIQNKPEFKKLNINGVKLPEYSPEHLKEVSVGAGVVLGGLGGAAAGTAGGFAAASATTAAVMALGTASTGTAIASLSGAAATNATLAAIGGGALAAGGGGIALGTTILGASTLGIGLLVGGVIFNITGSKLSDKADEAWSQTMEAQEKIKKICEYLQNLKSISGEYLEALKRVEEIYKEHLDKLQDIVDVQMRTDWNILTQDEQMTVENTVLLVSLLYNMCKVQLVLKSDNEDEMNEINTKEVNKSIQNAEVCLKQLAA